MKAYQLYTINARFAYFAQYLPAGMMTPLVNRSLHIILIALLCSGTAYAQDSFKSSAQELSEGKIDEAITKMTELLDQGKSSKELLSNLGYAYFQKNDMGNAMLYYHKALKIDPADSKIQESIQTVRDQLDIRITEIPDFVLITIFRKVTGFLSATVWGTLQVLTGLLSMISLGLFIFPKGLLSKRSLKWSGISCLVLSLLFGIFAFSKRQMESSQSQAVVMQSELSIHVSPDEISPVVAPVGSGNLVYILSELGEWYKVTLRDKDVGWIKKEEVAII